jgi:glycosyltransferase involved in cell wall biosynthesis
VPPPARAASAPPLFVDARHLELRPTGVGTWLRSILDEWATLPDAERIFLLTRGDVPTRGGLRASPIAAPSVLWHLVAAWRTWRAGGSYLSPDSYLVAILLGRRATLVVHDLTPIVLPGAHTRRSALSHRLLGVVARRVGRLVVPSEATRDDLVRHVRGRTAPIEVIPEAARTLPSGTSPSHPGPYVLYVGTIEPRKNVDVLVRAFTRAAPDGWRLVIAGGLGWLDAAARAELLAAAEADGRVDVLGYVSDDALSALYRDAEIFVYPSSYEGFGLPVLEAMQHGVPTVVSDAAALVEVAGDAALRVPLADLENGLVEVLARLMSSPDDRRALGAAGRSRANAFSWEAAARVLLAATGVRSSQR